MRIYVYRAYVRPLDRARLPLSSTLRAQLPFATSLACAS